MRRLAGLATLALSLLAGGCERGQPYQQKNGVWLFDKQPLALLAGEKLTPLNRRFARTQGRAFYRATPIEGADAASFQALDEHYARDARRAYWLQTYRVSQDYFTTARVRQIDIEGADPASFVPLTQDYARDARRIYFEGVHFAVEDPTSFQVLDDGYARDARRGYYMQTPIAGSDGASFAVLGAHYAKHATQVFYANLHPGQGGSGPVVEARRIAGGDEVDSFQDLEPGYAKSAKRVFYNGEVVEGADPASFEAVSDLAGTPKSDARDAKRRYYEGKPVAGD